MSTPKKLTDLTALGAAPANTDLLEIVDISDTTDNAAGSSKKVTVSELLTNAGGGIEFSTAVSGLGSETGQVADADTLLTALAKINDRLPLSAGSSYPVTGDLYLTAECMIGGLTAPDTFLHIRSNPVTNYGHATFEGIAGDDCYISFQDSSAGLTSYVGTDYNADSSGAHDTILANLDGGSIKFRTGSDNLQSGLNTQAEITTEGAFLIYGNYTDASNYERLAFTQNGAGTCTIAAQTLGTGTDNLDFNILAAGSGALMAGIASDTDKFFYLDGEATVIGGTSWSTRSTLVGRKTTGGYYSAALGWNADCAASTGAAIGAFADCEFNASLALPRGQHNSQNKHYPRIQCLYIETTDATQDAMEAPGQGAYDTIPCTIASNRSATISGTVIALQDDNTETASWQIHATVQNNGGTMTLVGSTVTAINNNADAWACEVAINDTDDSWEVLVTGEASTTIRWGAELMVNEISH